LTGIFIIGNGGGGGGSSNLGGIIILAYNVKDFGVNMTRILDNANKIKFNFSHDRELFVRLNRLDKQKL
jgi:uncharacterized membrane protein